MTRLHHEERAFTLEEYARLEEPEGFRTELVRGRIVKEPRPAAPHGRSQALLTEKLVAYVRDHDLGMVFTDVGVVVDPRGPTVRGPDVLFVSAERVPDPLPEGFLETPPDLAVEIVSPGNSASEIQEKVLEYLDAGSRMVWVVDPGSRTATIYRSRSDIEVVSEDEEIDGGDVLPGLRLRLGSVLPG